MGDSGEIPHQAPALAADGTWFYATGSTVGALAEDGTQLWQRGAGSASVAGTTVSEAGRLIVAATDGVLAAYDRNGNFAWSLPTGHAIRVAPAVSFFEKVLVPVDDGYLLAADARAGKVIWTARLAGRPRSRAVLELRGASFIATDAGLEAFSAGGEPLWRARLGGGATEPALGRSGRLYAVDGNGTVVRVDPGGKVIWTIPTQSAPAAPPIVDLDDVIYVATLDGNVHAIADRGGDAALRWRVRLASPLARRPVLAPGGTLYAALQDGSIIAIGRPLTGYGKTCEGWSVSGAACTSACSTCRAEFDRCASDPGCERIARCVLESGCTSATGCSLPRTCRSAIESTGGVNGESLRRASMLGDCAAKVCLGTATR